MLKIGERKSGAVVFEVHLLIRTKRALILTRSRITSHV